MGRELTDVELEHFKGGACPCGTHTIVSCRCGAWVCEKCCAGTPGHPVAPNGRCATAVRNEEEGKPLPVWWPTRFA